MGAGATKEDARLLLQFEQLLLAESVQRARQWFWSEFRPKKLKEYEEYRKLYPEGRREPETWG